MAPRVPMPSRTATPADSEIVELLDSYFQCFAPHLIMTPIADVSLCRLWRAEASLESFLWPGLGFHARIECMIRLCTVDEPSLLRYLGHQVLPIV